MSAVRARGDDPAGARLVVVGRDPRTALGGALDRIALAAAEAEPSIGSGPADGRDLVVAAAAPDPAGLAARAASNGWRVLLEPLGAVGATGLAALRDGAPAGRIVPALRRRHEPDARWARAAVGRGAIGLPWGAHAETLASRAPDALTEALDLADALERVAGVALLAAARLDRAPRASRRAGPAPGSTLLASLSFEHGIVGQAAVRIASAASNDGAVPGAPELAGLRVTGSHGTVLAELDAPLVELAGAHGTQAVRLGAGGADRLLAVFLGLPGGDPGDLASLADAARLCAIIEGPPRKGGQR